MERLDVEKSSSTIRLKVGGGHFFDRSWGQSIYAVFQTKFMIYSNAKWYHSPL